MLRDGRKTLQGKVIGLSASGIVVAGAGTDVGAGASGEWTVPWIRVAECRLDDHDMQAEAQSWLTAAEGLWRGQQRLERGDFALALDAFQSSGGRFQADTGEAGLLQAEGLLRSRLGLGVVSRDLGDVWPLVIVVAELRSGGAQVESLSALRDPLASGVAIVPDLPPLFVSEGGAAAAAVAMAAVSPTASTVDAIRLRVAQIARTEAQVTEPPGAKAPPRVRDDDGVPDWVSTIGLLDAWAEAIGPEPRKRAKARDKLERSDYPHAWQRAWAELARARSLERESVLSRAGEAVLAYLAAAEVARDEHPSLGRLAASQASRVLRAMGDVPSAARVEAAYALDPQEGQSD